MTVEERASEIVTMKIGPGMDYSEVEAAIEQALRDQIEECAKVADEHARVAREWNERGKAHTAESIANIIRHNALPLSPKTQSAIDKSLHTLSTTVDRAGELLRAAGVE